MDSLVTLCIISEHIDNNLKASLSISYFQEKCKGKTNSVLHTYGVWGCRCGKYSNGLSWRFFRNHKLVLCYVKYYVAIFYFQTLLRLFECFMESAPQLVLQIYILIRDPQAAKVNQIFSYLPVNYVYQQSNFNSVIQQNIQNDKNDVLDIRDK